MAGSGRSGRAEPDGVAPGERPACVALVPVVPTVQWSRVPEQPQSRADFVTQLIATAQHIPQTRSLWRATPADANAAYGAQRHKTPAQTAGVRTRHIA